MVRKNGHKSTKNLWIFCEGRTEKNYFNKLKYIDRIRRLVIKAIDVTHNSADGIVKEAINFKEKHNNFQEDDIIICVFDRDQNNREQLIKAKSLADQRDIKLVFSNPCFEYWILCHYGHFPNQQEKQEIERKILRYLGNYITNDPDLYIKTRGKIQEAVKNSKKMFNQHIRNRTQIISRESNPLTLMFELIDLINSFKN
ncbi:MAG TPA: RloB family protein [Candidatus Nanoarchaeia archaeon]|nr:RloB family protein [Candidatus Nanoarchaeia archaeon]